MATPTIVPGFDRDFAMSLAAEEIRRYTELLDTLSEAQWRAPTECTPWTVRDMAGHVLGGYEGTRSVRARLAELWDARRHGGNLVDALSATQIARRTDRMPRQVIADLRAAGPASVAARRRLPRLLRAIRSTVPMHTGPEKWSVAYLDDIVYTRDTWMHRIDTARAVGLEPELAPGHDGAIVSDIVREWGLRHARPYQLELSGPAGGSFGTPGGEHIALDAVEFCRLLSGRGHGEGLLAVEVAY